MSKTNWTLACICILFLASFLAHGAYSLEPQQDSIPPPCSVSPSKPARPAPKNFRPLCGSPKENLCKCDGANLSSSVAISVPSSDKIAPKEETPYWHTLLEVFLKWLFGWPGLILILLLVLLFSEKGSRQLKSILDRVHSFKVFDTEVVLNRQGGEEVEEGLAKLRNKVVKIFDKFVLSHGINEKHKKLITNYVRPLLTNFDNLEIRSTIHVQDVIFADGLYQLIDYFPVQGTGHGRVFSSRSGIIGKAWRLRKSQYAPRVPADQDKLILEWGMTPEQALDAGHGRKSFGCVILESLDERLGILYLDSPQENAFGQIEIQTWKIIEEAVKKGMQETGLISDLRLMNRDIIRPSAFIQIFST
jgi:hypothetical protein